MVKKHGLCTKGKVYIKKYLDKQNFYIMDFLEWKENVVDDGNW